MRLVHWLLAGSVVAASACADPALEQRVADLEKKVETIEKSGGAKGKAPAQPQNTEEEQAAAKVLKEASGLAEELKYDEAKAKLAELKSKYGKTRAARAAQRLEREIGVVGVDAGEFEVEKWYQGETSMADGKATLLVFWEVWCPHCKREVPKLNETHNKYKDKGLNVIGLTKITRNSTEEQVTEFMKEKDVQYATAKEQGDSMSKRFGVSGIPAAAVVKDGKVVWRGHPARLKDEMIEGWL
jgi:thiol-disulfide isomerase/thioredoxin